MMKLWISMTYTIVIENLNQRLLKKWQRKDAENGLRR